MRAARCLLGSVTKVLLLADIVVVKQLLLAKKKVARSLGRLESVSNFTEFVKAFSQFGAEMVELAHLTGDRQVSDSVSFSFPFVSIQTRFSTRYESRSQVNFNILYIYVSICVTSIREKEFIYYSKEILNLIRNITRKKLVVKKVTILNIVEYFHFLLYLKY